MKKYFNLFLLSFFVFFCQNINAQAETKYAVLQDVVNVREGPGTTYKRIILGQKGDKFLLTTESIIADEPQNGDCNSGWLQVEYNGSAAFICAKYAEIVDPNQEVLDAYNRPWTSPKRAIVGGASFIASAYISKGQFTSYLKKFNVNPDSYYSVYNHQYMANLAAPYSEAYTSYRSYKNNNLLSVAIEFTIPIFENMPEYTALPGKEANTTCQKEITDLEFETLLDAEEFPESYKCKLRLLHNIYPNWIFKSLKTGLDFTKSVNAEQKVSSIQGGDIYYDLSSGNKVETERGWYIANKETVAYYLDPRNFLIEERILMFEDLSFSESSSETVIKSILQGTFMEGISILDNASYASIFYEAGKLSDINAIYLASLAIQEAGIKVTNTTSGADFTYEGVNYRGLYNFFNIGASSSAKNPALAGLVWASGGSESVIVKPEQEEVPSEEPPKEENPENSNPEETPAEKEEETEKPVLKESDILELLGMKAINNCLTNFTVGTTLLNVLEKLPNLSVSIANITDTDILKTNQEIVITDGETTFTYTIVIKGDVDGDGLIGATDYVKIKNYIMEKENSNLSIPESLAADIDNNNEIGATDYVKIKNSIMEAN